ncbi:conserved hypothetical protein [Ricinus communis]|uniref:Protein TIFY n=1 Tax=Ricinus communis TaxID=3988 RepID=B9T6Z9_RICCO|nr:conserved hypothetical protein [Ricinus communis]|eukprot:XP_002534018.1 protein TIFY 6B isoform X2 [Ricinus communis]
MERDFLGLNCQDSLAVVKEEVNSDGYKEIGFSKVSGIQWPFLNKVSSLPHLMPFKAAQEDKTKRIVSDSIVPSGFLSIATVDALDPSQKQVAEIQRSFNLERQGGNHFTLASYPLQHDVHSVHHPDVKVFPVPNYTSSISTSHSFFKNHYATTGPSMVATTTKPQFLGGIPVTAPQTILPNISSVNRKFDSCVKTSGSPAQLTIFYGGTVNVYDDISPEKAQAIMFLAGNGFSIPSNMSQPKIQVQAPNSKAVATVVSPVNQPVITPPCSRLSSPLSVSSHTGAQSGSGSTSTEEIVAVKPSGVPTTPVSKPDTPKLASAMGSAPAAIMMPSVPQARKASLARFLEKRKERMMSAAPYNLCKNSLESSIQNPMD